MSRIRKPSPALVVAVVALFAALGGVAIAGPLGSDGKVRFCYRQASLDDPANGSSPVYVVNAGHPCDGDYPDTLTMNQTGPRGLPGPAGLPGPIGPQGLPGGVKGLTDQVTGKTLGGLKQVDKKTGAMEDKIAEARRRLAALRRAKGNVPGDVLALQQQALLQMINTLSNQLQAISDAEQQVIHRLGP